MVNIVKASGEKEEFSEEKLRKSIQRVNIPPELTEQVVEHVKSKLHEDIKTSEIYGYITDFLGKSNDSSSQTKYSLKKAIMELGPTGYPFEDYVSEILKEEGYKTSVRQFLQGKCISHEIDIIAEKDNVKAIIECKFHNGSGIKSQCHVPMYTKARFDDVKEKNDIQEVWIVTNTKITSDALNYALCSGLKVISWDYPEKGSFRNLVDKHKLYPLTALGVFSEDQELSLAQKHIVLARDICKDPTLLDTLGLPDDKRSDILSKCQFIHK